MEMNRIVFVPAHRLKAVVGILRVRAAAAPRAELTVGNVPLVEAVKLGVLNVRLVRRLVGSLECLDDVVTVVAWAVSTFCH